MKIRKNKIVLFFVCLLSLLQVSAQDAFPFKRKLLGIHDDWHQFLIPVELYPHTNHDFSDLRIQAYSPKGDTLNIPYILEEVKPKQIEKQVEFKIINESYRNDWFYFTIVCPKGVMANHLLLEFEEKNFDWHVNLDAAENLGDWLTILDDVRIVAFHNDESSYQFSKLKFRDSKFPYYRVSIHGTKKPAMKSVKLIYHEDQPGTSIIYPTENFVVSQNKEKQQTRIEFSLQAELPINTLSLFTRNHSDFLRPCFIEYATDSIYSDGNWHSNFVPLLHAHISSDDHEPFHFTEVKAKKIRITINNHDDDPIEFESVQVAGPQYRLLLRAPDVNADYFLIYGNKKARSPIYDLVNFKAKIPINLDKLRMGPEIKGAFQPEEKMAPLFQNKWWLWLVLVGLVILLAYFSFKMLKSQN